MNGVAINVAAPFYFYKFLFVWIVGILYIVKYYRVLVDTLSCGCGCFILRLWMSYRAVMFSFMCIR